MGVDIPSGYGLFAFHTLTEGDPEEMIWTWGVNVGSSASVPDLPERAATAWEDHLAAQTSTVVQLTRVTLKVGPVSTGPTYEFLSGAVGTNGGSLPPPNCAVLVKKLTAVGGRKGRGRMYLPGISSVSGSLDSGGNFGSVAAGDVQSAIEDMAADIEDTDPPGPADMVLLHSDATTPTSIVSYLCEQRLATQRRRLRP